MSTEKLAQDVGWEASGHLSDIALSCAADGEEALLDAEMLEHMGTCDVCVTRLGLTALRSAEVAEAFARAARVEEKVIDVAPATTRPASPRPKRRVPVFAVAAAMVVAVLGAVPSMLHAPLEVMQALTVARKVAPSMVRLTAQAVSRAWSGSAGAMSVIVWGMAIGLMAAGFGIARRASRQALVNGGER